MRQPTINGKKGSPSHGKGARKKAKKYGTSKLEAYFASEFLDKLGLTYVYQYEAKDIGRFFDFAVTEYVEREYVMESKDGIRCVKQDGQAFPLSLLIEVDGDYFHSNPSMYDAGSLNRMQRRNKFVDKKKDDWAGMRCVPLLRIWESDIRNDPKKVRTMLLAFVAEGKRRKNKDDSKKRPH